jgi:hypothetical protein
MKIKDFHVKFLGQHGYDSQLKEALNLLIVGKEYEVIGGSISDCSTSYILKGFEKTTFNSVMFDSGSGVKSRLQQHYRGEPDF